MKPLKLLQICLFCLVGFLGVNSFTLAAPLTQTSGEILYVKPGADGTCTSWADACELQDALALAEAGDQIWVAAGIYKPTAGTDRTATFLLESGVAIYGGFAGTETSLEERDWKANPTTLSGDLDAENTNADNSYHVVTANSANTATILDGFTISGGNANGVTEQGQGGGMRIHSANIILSNITFSSNAANIGGGMYSIDSNPTLINVNFYGNIGWSDGCGGGMYIARSNPTISNATFAGNSASRGGGMCSYSTSLPILTNVTFDGNTATNHGGGMYNNNSIPTLVNVTFSGNIAISNGGAIYNDSNNSFSPTLTNVTIFENTASSGGGIYNRSSYGSVLKNCILWDNTNGQIVDQSSTAPTITYSIIQGDTDWGGEGNLNTDPLLESLWFNGSFTMTHALGEGSPAIDAGDPLSCPETDQRALPRPVDGDGDDDEVCDMGAYELQPYILTTEIIGNGEVDKAPNQPDYALSQLVTLTATADPGWTFSGWTGDVTSTDNPLSVTVESNISVTATFTQNEYSLSVTVDPADAGTVTLDPPQGPYHYGDVVTLTPTANAGYTFSSWSGATVTENKVTITGNTSITATFTQNEYSLSVTADPTDSGSVTLAPPQGPYHYGDVVTLTPTANAGYTFSTWTGDVQSTDNPLTVTIEGDTTITANFTQKEYNLSVTVDPADAGTVTLDPPQGPYHYGDVVTLTPTANAGYTFSGWTGDVTSTDNPLTVTIEGDTTITANFTQNEYSLSVTVDPADAGTVTLDPPQGPYHYGDLVTLTHTANAGYTFSSWSGATVTDNQVTIVADTIVTAIFTKDTYGIFLPLILR